MTAKAGRFVSNPGGFVAICGVGAGRRSKFINQFRSQNPNVIFFVSKIIPMNPSGCGNCTSGVAALDALLTATWASTNSTPTSPIYIVDQSATINTGTDTADGVHPNAAGAQKMADVAYTAIAAQNYF